MLSKLLRPFLFLLLLCQLAVQGQSFLPICRNFGPEDYGEDAEFRCAAADNKGTLYFGTNYGILLYKGEKRVTGKNWSFMLLPKPDVVLSLYMDTAAQRLYVGGQNDFGYFQLSNYQDGEFVSLKGKMRSQGSEVWHIEKCGKIVFFHSVNKLMMYLDDVLSEIEPWNKGIFHNMFKVDGNTILLNGLGEGWFYFKNDKFTLADVKGAKLPSDKCYSILAKGKGRYLFFFRNSGVYEGGFEDGSFSDPKKISDPGLDKLLAEKQVYGASYASDSSKIIIGTLAGGAFLINNRDTLSASQIVSEMQSATSILSVYGIFTDQLRNTWLLGKRNLSLIPSDLSLAHAEFRGVTIRSLAELKNELFVASGSGLYKLTRKNGLFAIPQMLKEGSFTKLAVVGDTLFATSGNELVKYYSKKVNVIPSPVPVNDISSVNNSLWIATQNGLYVGTRALLENKALLKDKDILGSEPAGNKIYVLVSNEGILELNKQNEVTYTYKLNKEFSSTQNARLFAEREKLLISDLFDTYELNPLSHTITSAHQRSRLWMHRLFENGRKIIFEFDSTNNTLLRLSEPGSDELKKANSLMSQVEINDAFYDGGYYYLASKTGLYLSRLLVNKPIESVNIFKLTAGPQLFFDNNAMRISYENNRLVIINCALNSFYSSFANTHYIYRLIPYDTAWAAQVNSDISFSHLPWGTYTLEVKAQYGNQQETGVSKLHFTVFKPWWATWWAMLIWILLFLLFVYAVVQISVYRLKRSKIKLEKIVVERTAEVVQQKNEIEAQKEEIEHKNHEITDSINYAQRIQSSLLKDEAKLRSHLPGAFVLYLPKDIVSGDFYWFADIGEHTIVASADCTGHGVPGAFMSMLGVAKLNELAAKNIFRPDQLLHELNHLIVETLGQNTANSDSRDGMDIALVAIHKKTKKLYYAGANRPLYIVNIKEDSIAEIKPTKLPVGGGQYGEDRDYQLHELAISGDMSVYLCTDGYADQFGGPEGKKLMSKRMQQILVDIAALSPAAQKEKLKETYLTWKGKLEQIDDVCVIGISL